jgi:hypothetical protein
MFTCSRNRLRRLHQSTAVSCGSGSEYHKTCSLAFSVHDVSDIRTVRALVATILSVLKSQYRRLKVAREMSSISQLKRIL